MEISPGAFSFMIWKLSGAGEVCSKIILYEECVYKGLFLYEALIKG